MNPRLSLLAPYPFERLKSLLATETPSQHFAHIGLGIGEPKHATPPLIHAAIQDHLSGLARYPATVGEPLLRDAFANWLERRYGVVLTPAQRLAHTLPVLGSREALFSLTQTVVSPGGVVVCPNPFYQIYEGSALLAGATLHFAPTDPAQNFAVNWGAIAPEVWQKTQLVFVCSPGNPTGAVMQLAQWQQLFDLSDRYGFVIASDECYSEIYFGNTPPLGSLQAAKKLGRDNFKNLVALTSLSKRSNAPGLRSGFACGDAAVMKQFLLYRTYHGSAMGPTVQAASAAAWDDEAHVQHNRDLYRAKFAQVLPLLDDVMDVRLPDAAFYLWAGVPKAVCQGLDTAFAQALFAQYNVTVLPGSFLGRADAQGQNPGSGRVRLALVADAAECVEAAQRIRQFIQSQPSPQAFP